MENVYANRIAKTKNAAMTAVREVVEHVHRGMLAGTSIVLTNVWINAMFKEKSCALGMDTWYAGSMTPIRASNGAAFIRARKAVPARRENVNVPQIAPGKNAEMTAVGEFVDCALRGTHA